MDQTLLDPVIYVVIPVHNRLDATRECLDSLQCQAHRHFQVVLVDDGSTDGTFDYIKEMYPEVILSGAMGTYGGRAQLTWALNMPCCTPERTTTSSR